MSNTHNDVCHAWANQTGKHRKGFNMFYDGETIFSYGRHFPIARHVVSPNAGPVVLFTTEGYSISTSKHKTFTRRAIGHLTTFDVADVLATHPEEHSANWDGYIKRAATAIDKAKRARTYKDMHLRDASGALAQADEYRLAFGLDKPCVTMESLEPTIGAMRKEAAEAAQRAQARHDEVARERTREARAFQHPIMARWLKGDTGVAERNHHTQRPWVRVKGDEVQTTWGASVPLDVALCVFRLASKVRRIGKGWEATGLKQLRVGDFALTRIGPTGNIVVGCHDIPYRFAKLAADLAGISIAA